MVVGVTNGDAEEGSSFYHGLDPMSKEIRILYLEHHGRSTRLDADHPNGTTPGASTQPVLAFRLKTISLCDRIVPHYEAISYHWGDDQQRVKLCTIFLDGRAVSIPSNADAALRDLCLSHGRYSVWIDAVCIDHTNIHERNDQVAIMGDIYAKATRVLVWLDHRRFGGEDALNAVLRLRTSFDIKGSERLKTPHSSSSKSPPIGAEANKSMSFGGWTSLYTFFSNKWFTRAWVVQEVSISKQAFCFQGNIAVDFEEIATVATYLHMRRTILPENPKRSALTGIENAAMIWIVRRAKQQQLASLLRVVYTFNCTDPRDMVYSVLGMRHKSAQRSRSESRIIPIYEEPVLEVYAKATKAAVIETGSLGILKHAHSLRATPRKALHIEDFPSWALRMDLRGHYHINPVSYRRFRFNADDGLPLELWNNDSSRVLRVQGVLVDRIAHVSDCMRWKQYGDSNLFDTMTAAAVLLETYTWTRDIIPVQSEERLSETFAVTVAAGQDANGRKLAVHPEYAGRLLYGFRNIAHAPETPSCNDRGDDAASLHSVSTTTSSRSVDVKDFDTDLAADNPDATYALAAMMKGAHHRTVFITQRGLLGLGTDNVQPGDALCILFGGSVPLVLRPQAHFWRFVGDAFVEELMEVSSCNLICSAGVVLTAVAWIGAVYPRS